MIFRLFVMLFENTFHLEAPVKMFSHEKVVEVQQKYLKF